VRNVFLDHSLQQIQLSPTTTGIKMKQNLPTRNAEGKVAAGNFQHQSPHRQHISYSKREGHIRQMEDALMRKYRVGYSGLHKMLVMREGQQQFIRAF